MEYSTIAKHCSIKIVQHVTYLRVRLLLAELGKSEQVYARGLTHSNPGNQACRLLLAGLSKSRQV